MRITGVIAEYNPFHLGHAYHLEQVKKAGAEGIIVVMSGCFTQRGDAAFADKFARARAAVAGGADIVVELPAVWSVACAERFAFAGVSLLADSGCVDTISFGSECGDADLLKKCAELTSSGEYSALIKSLLASGISYPSASSLAMEELSGSEGGSVLNGPNDTLAIEYIKALYAQTQSIGILPVKRIGSAHDSASEDERVKSASELRKILSSNDDARGLMPQAVENVILSAVNGGRVIDREKYSVSVMSRLKRMTVADFAELPEVSEGLENRLFDAARRAVTLDEACELAKTKRYTMARIRRIYTAAYLGITDELQRKTPPYMRVLALSSASNALLSELTRNSRIPVLLRSCESERLDYDARLVYNTECIATDLYSLCCEKPLPSGRDMTSFLEKQ